MAQTFIDLDKQAFNALTAFPGCSWSVFAEPVPSGSIHRLNMKKGAVIPAHTHPADEYVYVLSGKLVTGTRECSQGCFWFTPAGIKQGPHVAATDVEILTIRLGAIGEFDD